MLGGCSLKATESPKQLLGAECSHQMNRRRVRPPMPAVNSRRLRAGEVLQAARVSTAIEKNISMSQLRRSLSQSERRSSSMSGK